MGILCCSQCQLENWAEFIVYKSQQGEDITKLKPTDFAPVIHGDADVYHEFLDKLSLNGMTATEVHFDDLDVVTAI